MTFYLHPQEPIAPGLRRIAREQIDIALGKFADNAVPLDQQVHSLRTRCKKLRGILRMLRPRMGEVFEIQDRDLRTAAKLFAGHRDSDVIAKTIRTLGGSGVQVLATQTPVARAEIGRSLMIMRQCRDAVDGWPSDLQGFDDLAPGFSRTCQRCLDAWQAALRQPSDRNFHSLRKMTKYHWYQVRILERLNKHEIRQRRETLRELQATLGDAHDLAMTQSVLESRQDLDMDLLQRAIIRKRELYADGMKICADVYARPAEELVADYSRWWREGRADPETGRRCAGVDAGGCL